MPYSPVQLLVSVSGLYLALATYWLTFYADTLAFAHLGPGSRLSYEEAAGLDYFLGLCNYF